MEGEEENLATGIEATALAAPHPTTDSYQQQ